MFRDAIYGERSAACAMNNQTATFETKAKFGLHILGSEGWRSICQSVQLLVNTHAAQNIQLQVFNRYFITNICCDYATIAIAC